MMKKYIGLLLVILLGTFGAGATDYKIQSPDGKLKVNVSDENGLVYKVWANDVEVIAKSPLGIYRDDINYPCRETISKALPVAKDKTEYTFDYGKKSYVNEEYNQQEFVVDKAGYSVIFRLYNSGVCYAYKLLGDGNQIKVYNENSGFVFPENSKAFLTQLAKGKSGWAKTNPSYEDHYHMGVPLNEESDHRQGWIFPALIKTNEHWILLTEAGTDGNYVACHLSEGQDNKFMVEFPYADQNLRHDPTWASVETPFTTPWRVIVISNQLGDIVETTMVDDLVDPQYKASKKYEPGKASWSWLYYADLLTTYEGTVKFIDLAAQLDFKYCLIDALWDTQIGRPRIEELAAYAKKKNVELILWYNSNGNWNEALISPTDIMNNEQARKKEMQWLKNTGIAGIKVDFFGGDKQVALKLYEDILKDANEYGILCDFHGATLPRGWSRMYPSFITAEAVMGQEFCRGDHQNEKLRPRHCTVIPFTRNVVGPIDFTPTVLNEKLGLNPDDSKRVTTAAFELALPVIFFSPLTHFGLIPDDLKNFPDFVWSYFKKLPTTWDQTKYISGYPGQDVVLARKKAKDWYVAGINGENKSKTITVDLSFAPDAKEGKLIVNDPNDRNKVMIKKVNLKKSSIITINLQPNDGFVLEL